MSSDLPTPLGSTIVGQALKNDLDSEGKWNQISFADGTIQTTATAGSVSSSTDNAIVRFDGTSGAQQNSGIIIDDSDSLGIGTTPGATNQLHVLLDAAKDILIDGATNPRTIATGSMRFEQKPSIVNTRAITINLDINSQPLSHAQVTNITTTGLAPGETASAYDVNVDRSTSTGGVIRAYEMSISGAGSAVGHLMHADPGIIPLVQFSGEFINIEQAWDENGGFTDVTTAFNSTGTNVTLFDTNGDAIHIGMDSVFDGIEINLDTFAGGAGIKPVFAYSSGGGTPVWTTFVPSADETQGFRQNGVINWLVSDLTTPTWAVATINAVSKFYIRITRTQASIPVDPIEDTIQVASTTTYFWDAEGNVNIASVTVPSVIGGIGAGDDLTLQSTSNATKGSIFFGAAQNSAYDEVNERWGFGTATPESTIHFSDTIGPIITFEDQADITRGYIAFNGNNLLWSINKNPVSSVFSNTGEPGARISVVTSSGDSNISFYTSNVNNVAETLAIFISNTGNLGIATALFGTSAVSTFAISNGTLGDPAADMVQMASEDNGAGNASWLLQPELGTALRYGNNILDVESGDLTLLPATGNSIITGVSYLLKRFLAIVTLDTGDAETLVGLTPNAVIMSAAIRVSTQITGLDSANHSIRLGVNGVSNKYINVAQGSSQTTIDVNVKSKFTFTTAAGTESAALVLTIEGGSDNIPSGGAVEVEIIYLDSANLPDV